jgi:hypothetical protein
MGQPCEEEYYTPEEAAQKLKVSLRTIKEHLPAPPAEGLQGGAPVAYPGIRPGSVHANHCLATSAIVGWRCEPTC